MTKSAVAYTLAFSLLVRVAAAAVPWQHSLSLANGGYWPERVSVTITNVSSESAADEPVRLSLPGLAGTRIEALRVRRPEFRVGTENEVLDQKPGHFGHFVGMLRRRDSKLLFLP